MPSIQVTLSRSGEGAQGAGNDKISTGYGNNAMTGGPGAATFVFRDNAPGQDETTDFNAAEKDRFDFSENSVMRADVGREITDDGHGNAQLAYATNYETSTVMLDHVAPAAVNHDMFVF